MLISRFHKLLNMEEFVIKIEVPKELVGEFKKVLEELVEESETRFILSLLRGSKLTEEEAIKLGEGIKHGIAKRHGVYR